MFWLLLALSNCFLAYLAEKQYDMDNKKCIIWLCIIIAIDTFFVGLRDFSVGIDTGVYIEDYYIYANNRSFTELLDLENGYDLGFLIIAYISGLLSDNPQSLLILTEFLIIGFICMGLYEYKKSLSLNMPMFFSLFWLLYGNETYNLMRQFCAIAILFYAFSLFLRGKWMFYIILQFLSYFFHSSSVIFIAVPILSIISNFKGRVKYSLLLFFVIGIISFISMYFLFLDYIGNLGILKDVYIDRYGLGSDYENNSISFGVRYILQYLMPIILIFFIFREKKLDMQQRFMLLALFIISCSIEQMRFVMIFFARLSYYWGMVFIVYFSYVIKQKGKYVPFIAIYFLLYFIIAYNNYTLVIPGAHYFYSSKILNI